MEGVTTAIVLATLVGLMFPQYVKNTTWLYAAFGIVLLIILIGGLTTFVGSTNLRFFMYFLVSLLQMAALILIALAAGNRSLSQIRSEMKDAINEVRTPPSSPASASAPAAQPAPEKPKDPKAPLPFD
jgi:hypothetical protein